MAYDDVRAMIGLACDGDTLESWISQVKTTSRLLRGSRLNKQIAIARSILRTENGRIADARFLHEITDADALTARDLIFGRYFASRPLAVAFATSVLHPLAQAGRVSIELRAIGSFLATELATATEATRVRTLSAIVTEFSRAGVVTKAGSRSTTIALTGRIPATIALADLIDAEIRERREASDRWLASKSRAAVLFALRPATVEDAIESLVRDGRLSRSFYSGEPRVVAA